MKTGANALNKPIYVVIGFGKKQFGDEMVRLRKVCGELTDKKSRLNGNEEFEYPIKRFKIVNVKIERV